ncbi:probable serine/threonine-protein kinase tsuA isoform X3 [Hylaeus anthracinus]|uniref:probable serine/threonine-protein kinase tsuA isoform X3 n=1 Tax=Hylaeus anthracinus TaxID=313031 RepID=UPI0023B9D50B|nr:probable serine/threonine-protein kinase tsuA isoform X3 [Hylaeus anthracinus]
MSVLNQSGDDAVECPLCMEPLEVDDLNFFPCTCGYQICRFCWHRIRTDENGLCPACRKAYSENPADFKPLSMEEIARLKAEKRLKDQQRKQRVTENRKHLANVRVVQKNLVFVVGLPLRLADADVLKRHEYFGKFGKIHKVVINQSTSYAGSQGPSASAYVTYQRQEDALRAIEAVNNVVMDGRTIKTSLGTTKYCSHFMRNQPCPKPDCMYLHDLGDQEASFTKEEMHQGKHQEYERKLVQSLHASHASAQRKPTPSPSVTGSIVRENGSSNSQAKEAWPSLQTGQTNSTQINCKELSPPSQATSQPNNITNGSGTTNQQSHVSSGGSTHQQNNNNKGESINLRRGKSNSESKAQAARNKHKNCQNKEKHSTRTTSRSESSSIGAQTNLQPQINGQKDIRNFSSETNSDVLQKLGNKCKSEQQQPPQQQSPSQQQQQNNKGSKLVQQQQPSQELKVNGVVQNGERRHSDSETDQQREGSTPASTISSTEDSNVNQQVEHLAESSEENSGAAILGSSPASTNSSQGANQQPPPGLHNGSQMQLSHRSIFQADNNSFFSSNTFQKISTTTSVPPTSLTANSNLNWTSTGLASIPDSLPMVQSTEDWQAAFGFQPEQSRTNHVQKSSPSSSPGVTFNSEGFVDEEVYNNLQYTTLSESSGTFTSSLLVNSPASKFMADFQQNSLQQRLALQAQQNQENCEYIKQNGHATLEEVRNHKESGSDIKADDDLGFDPFHETQKALAELMENEMQLQQQRLFQQQQQQQREREEQNRIQHQQNIANLGQQHFPQVAHIAHLQQQAQHLQNLQVLQQSHSLLSRLPQNLLQSGTQSPAQSTVAAASLGQRSRLPPPGAQPPQQNAYLPNGNPLLNSQGISKCAGDAVYTLKDWCDINNQQQQQQFHHQTLHQKGGWNNFGPIADWTSIDPAIVSSSRPLPFQTTSTWQFPHVHPTHTVSHTAQQEQQNASTQHWAMQPPPGFAAPATTGQLSNQQPSTTTQPHTKLISAGSEIENL